MLIPVPEGEKLKRSGHAVVIASVVGSDGKLQDSICEHYLTCAKCAERNGNENHS